MQHPILCACVDRFYSHSNTQKKMEIKIEEDIYLNLYKKWLNCVKVVTVQNGENGKNKTPLSGWTFGLLVEKPVSLNGVPGVAGAPSSGSWLRFLANADLGRQSNGSSDGAPATDMGDWLNSWLSAPAWLVLTPVGIQGVNQGMGAPSISFCLFL